MHNPFRNASLDHHASHIISRVAFVVCNLKHSKIYRKGTVFANNEPCTFKNPYSMSHGGIKPFSHRDI